MHSININSPTEFSFNECYTFINRSLYECLHIASQNRIRKLLKISGKFFLIEITEKSKNKIGIKFLNSKPSAEKISYVKNYVHDWLDLSCDLKPFYKFAEQDKLLKKIALKYSGPRLIGIPDLFEAMTWAIIGQQINLSFAYKLKKNFVEKYGEKFLFDKSFYYVYPSPDKISKINKQDLLELQFSKQKAEYVIEAAKAIIDKKISKEDLQKLSFNQAKEKLCEIKGVGNWTANYVIMKCMRNPDAFPIEDVGLHNAIKNNLNLDSKPTIEDIKKMSSQWQGWYAYSTFYLWRSLID